MELWIGALNLGFLYSFMTMGVFITFRVHDFPDITVDGSFTTGAAVAAVLMVGGVNPFVALLAAFGAGAAAGSITALIHTRLNINGLLAGILVMTGLYSINLHVMGRSNIPLLNQTTLFTYLERVNPGLHTEVWITLALLAIMGLFWCVMSLFFRTDMGIAMRVTGNNPAMAAAAGVHVARMTVIGVALANGLVGMSGALIAQYQGFADIGMGIGTIVIGLAAVIIGESVLRMRSMAAVVLSVILGSVIFRLMIAVALYVGMNPIDLKLLTAAFVLITLIVSKRIGSGRKPRGPLLTRISTFFTVRRITLGLVGTGAILLGLTLVKTQMWGPSGPSKPPRIGVVQFALEPNVEICKQGILKALKDHGYVEGKNVEIIYKNAQADFSMINAIIQDFMRREVDIIVPLSTPCVQAAVQLAGKKPGIAVVFTYIFDPYRIGAAKAPDDHISNMTGVSCPPPIEKMVDLIKEMFPDRKKIGLVWNSSEANSEATLSRIRPHALKIGLEIIEATVTGPAEVLDASRSLVAKGAQVFLNAGDNTLNVSFDSFAKVAGENDIPLFSVDSELIDNSLVAFGPDYYQTGYDGGTYLARVLNGEDTAGLPIYATEKTAFIINADRADRHGFKIDKQILKRADRIIGQKHETARTGGEPEKRVALFMFSDHEALAETARGVRDQLEKSGVLTKHNMMIDLKSAQNEFYLAQSIAQDIVRQEYDLVITLSTPVLQVMARANQTIPHIFGAVTDPYQTGVVKGPHDHPSHITGVATSEPVETTIQVLRELLPHARRIGMIWNPAEACSEICTLKARKAAAAYGFELIESTVSGPAEIGDALRSLMSKEIDVFYTSGDNTVASVQKTVNQILRKAKIPCFTNVPSDVESGALVSIGADFYEVGQEIARVAARVIAGESPKDIPIKSFAPEKRWVNADIAKEYGIKLSQGFLDRAAQVIRTP
jgi:putative ABC transport system permease protein